MVSTLIRAASATLLATLAAGVPAQPTDARVPGPPRAGDVRTAIGAASAVAAPGYRSVFDGYRRFDDQAVMPWPESNAQVGRIGGWRAYAREVQRGAADDDAAVPAAPASAAAAGMPDMPRGHDRMTMPRPQPQPRPGAKPAADAVPGALSGAGAR